MFDGGHFALGIVRIDRHVRRRRNDSWSLSACRPGGPGHDTNPRSINFVGNVDVVGNVDILRNAGHVGNVGNVRLRL